ncbi:MAG: TrkH family potassium uptake protein [Micrococcales bacterium]|nr:TrkH family potassium uptake protein [Micrococcales bacterium]
MVTPMEPRGSVFDVFFANPARLVVTAFAAFITVGTLLLISPLAAASGHPTHWVTALFTATSASCVTGLAVVDTGTYWSTFGQLVILGLIQVGGLGVMTMGSLMAILIGRRLGLRSTALTEAEARGIGNEDAKRVLVGIFRMTIVIESLAALALFLRFWLGYREPVGQAAYDGVFHAVSAFNNAGFGLKKNNIADYVSDPWINLPIMIAVVLGGIGFPVLWEVTRDWRRARRFTLHTKITLLGTVLLLTGGTLALLIGEWSNPKTLGGHGVGTKVLAAAFQSVIARTAGFNSISIGDLHEESLFVLDGMMFVGGGSAGTAGGIKITTFALLAFVIWAELRGEPTVHLARRRLSGEVIRQAVAVALLSVGVVGLGTMLLLDISPFSLSPVLFEAVSAFATVGLSTGITAQFSDAGQLVLVALMFIGRLGTLTLGAGLALRDRARRYEYPEERVIVG